MNALYNLRTYNMCYACYYVDVHFRDSNKGPGSGKIDHL